MSMTKQQAMALLSQKVEDATNNLTECQKIADEYGLEFTIRCGGAEAASYRSRAAAIEYLKEELDWECSENIDSNLDSDGMYDHGDYSVPEAGWLPNWISSSAYC